MMCANLCNDKMLLKARDAGAATERICGGGSQTSVYVPRLTPRSWLERRWREQHDASRRPARLKAAASSTLDAPVVQNPALVCDISGQHWTDVVIINHQQVLQQQDSSQVQHVPANISHYVWAQRQQQQQHVEQTKGHAHERAPQQQWHLQQCTGVLESSAATSSTRQFTAAAGCSSQQLMQAIKVARKVHQLQRLYQHHKLDMDMLHCTSMLNRLAHLHQHLLQQKQREQQFTVKRTTDPDSLGAEALAHTPQAAYSPPVTAAHHNHSQVHRQAQQQHNSLEQQQHAQVLVAEDQSTQHSARSRVSSKQHQHSQAGGLLLCLLRDFMSRRVTSAGPRQISSTLWVIARCSTLLPDRKLLQQTAATLLKHLLSPPPPAAAAAIAAKTAASIAVSTAVCAYTPADTQTSRSVGVTQPGGEQQQMRRRIRHQLQASGPLQHQQQQQQQQQLTLLHTGSSIDVANTVWAVGRLSQVLGLAELFADGADVDIALNTLEQLCCYHLLTQRPDAVFISSSLGGFALMGHPVPQLFSAVVHRAGNRYIRSLQSQQLLTVCWSLAKLGHYDQQLFTKLMWRAVLVRRALLPQHVSLLLWAAGRLGHKGGDPRAIAQLLQVWKQPDSSSAMYEAVRGQHVANLLYGLMQLGQLQQQRSWVLTWLLQLVMQKLDDFQPAGIAVVLTALMQLTQGTEHTAAPAAAAAAVHHHHHHQLQQQQQQFQAHVAAGVSSFDATHNQQHHQMSAASHHRQSSHHSDMRLHQGSSAVSVTSRQLGVWSSSDAAHSHQLVPLYRELSRRITAQIPQTRPPTLYQIITALARAGYYDARLYTKLAAAAAQAVTPADTQREGVSHPCVAHEQLTYSVHQQLQLVCVFAHYQHPVPALWSAVLPQLTAPAVLCPDELVLLLSASRFSGCEQQPSAVRCLLQLIRQVQQQQLDLSVTQLVQLSAAGSWILQAAALHQQQRYSDHQQNASGNRGHVDLAGDVERDLHRLMPRLVSVVLAQPHVLPTQSVPLLLEAAVRLQSSDTSNDSIGRIVAAAAAAADDDDDDDDSAVQWSQRIRCHSQHVVGVGQLKRLANIAVEHLCHWRPSALVMLLSCHTQALLFDALLADAYAEELLARIEQCSVQSLVQLLSVLAASSKGQQGYCHSQLVTTAARQLHGKLLLACDVQLQAAVTALQQLGQGDSPACRAAARLLQGSSSTSNQG